MKLNKKCLMMMTLSIATLSVVGCSKTETVSKADTVITEENNEQLIEEVTDDIVTEESIDEINEESREEGYIGEKDPTPSDEVYYTVTNGLGESMSMTADDAMLQDAYGIDPQILSSQRVEMGMNRAAVFECAIFEVNDESDIEKVKQGIAKRQQDLQVQWESYLEDQFELIKNAQTAVNGNMVLYIVSSDADQIVEAFLSM